MKWLWLVGGGLILLVALVAVVGAMLPQTHQASRKARFRVSPEVFCMQSLRVLRTGVRRLRASRFFQNRTDGNGGGNRTTTARK